MTKSELANTLRCKWCRKVIAAKTGPGRPKLFCGQRCRQWDWVSRQRSRELELSDNELVVVRDQLDRLHDDLYVLSCAVMDVERDMQASGRRTVRELHEMLTWLLAAAKPLGDVELSAPSAPSS